MVTWQGLLILLFLETTSGSSCPDRCTCSPLDSNPVKVDCSFRELRMLPLLPSSTQELYLQENILETIPAGALDTLQMLRVLNLSSNPWYCDCRILYLKYWLEDNSLTTDPTGVRCFSPLSLHKRPISDLRWRELPTCSTPQRLCSDFLFADAFLFILVLLNLLICICTLLITRKTKFKVEVCDDRRQIPGTLPSTYQLTRRTGRVLSNSSLLMTHGC